MKNLSDYIDQYGFIGHRDYDGSLEFGDGAQRMGMYHFFLYLLAESKEEIANNWTSFFVKYDMLFLNGEPTRHWDHTKWYGRRGTFSRDQLIPTLACLGMVGWVNMLELFYALRNRGMFCWNTKKIGQQDDAWKLPDFCGPAIWGMFLRAYSAQSVFKTIVFYPFIFLTGIVLLLDSCIRIAVGYLDSEDVGDDLNHTVVLLYAKRIRQTPLAWAARKLYYYCRPSAGDQGFRSLHRDVAGPISAFQFYFNGDAPPPLDVLAKEVIEKEFKNA